MLQQEFLTEMPAGYRFAQAGEDITRSVLVDASPLVPDLLNSDTAWYYPGQFRAAIKGGPVDEVEHEWISFREGMHTWGSVCVHCSATMIG